MSYQDLLSFIQVVGLDESKASDLLQLVESALDELDEEDPRYDGLLEIEDELVEGEFPLALLQTLLAQRPSSGLEALDDVQRLERDYRSFAAAYGPEQWRSNFYLELERHLSDSAEDELLDCVDGLRERITRAWQKYEADYLSISTRSAETEVGHLLMKEGYEGWMRALDLVETEAEDEEILKAAEEAVRLLVAVGQLDRDVRMQAGLRPK